MALLMGSKSKKKTTSKKKTASKKKRTSGSSAVSGTAADKPREDRLRQMKRAGLLDWLGAYDVRAFMPPSTTRQTAGLHLAVAAAPTSAQGILAGEDTMTGWPVFHDEVTGYRQGTISSPNCAIIGDVGAGKSSFLKTWGVMRHLLLGRRVVIIDKKMQASTDPDHEHEGEYALLSRGLGIEPIRFTGRKGGVRINPLDPAITGGGGLAADQRGLLKAILAEVIQRDLTVRESKALRVAHETALARAQGDGREATVMDITDALLGPDEEVVKAQRGAFTVQDFLEWGIDIGLALEECVEGDLAGLIDGPTSAEVHLNAGLTVFDISALPDDGPAVPVVMAIVNTWLRNTIVAQREIVPTFFGVEEGWHLVSGSFARISQQNTKKSRGLAFGTTTAYQHLSDVPADSPAIATIKEAGTVLLFRQVRRDDAEHCQRLFGLPPEATEVLMNLPTGCALMIIGSRPPIMLRALRSKVEAQFANTDSALLSAARLDLEAEARSRAADEPLEFENDPLEEPTDAH